MEIMNLYKYTIENGVRVTPEEPKNTEYELMFRLISEEGFGLSKDSSEPVLSIDVLSVEGWEEIEAPELWLSEKEDLEETAEETPIPEEIPEEHKEEFLEFLRTKGF